MKAEHVAFECFDEALRFRVERVARSRNMTVDAFVADAIGCDVDCFEEEMIVHPTTGELLHDDRTELFEERECEVTSAPIGQEEDPQWKRATGTKHVQFSVHLTPAMLERVEYPHMVYDEASDSEVACALIPIDPEGIPILTLAARTCSRASRW